MARKRQNSSSTPVCCMYNLLTLALSPVLLIAIACNERSLLLVITVLASSTAGVVVSCKIPNLVSRVRFPGGARYFAIINNLIDLKN